LAQQKEGLRYVIPHEEQWEFACRAVRRRRGSFGDDEAQIEKYGWVQPMSMSQCSPVGQKGANPFGLHDVYGNAAEIGAGRQREAGYRPGARRRREFCPGPVPVRLAGVCDPGQGVVSQRLPGGHRRRIYKQNPRHLTLSNPWNEKQGRTTSEPWAQNVIRLFDLFARLIVVACLKKSFAFGRNFQR